jgi:hypothetical protein
MQSNLMMKTFFFTLITIRYILTLFVDCNLCVFYTTNIEKIITQYAKKFPVPVNIQGPTEHPDVPKLARNRARSPIHATPK